MALKLKEKTQSQWTFLSNHPHVLMVLAQFPDRVLREVAENVGITERAVQSIVADLENGGYLKKEKVGRANRYKLSVKKPLRHPVEAHRSVEDLIKMIVPQN